MMKVIRNKKTKEYDCEDGTTMSLMQAGRYDLTGTESMIMAQRPDDEALDFEITEKVFWRVRCDLLPGGSHDYDDKPGSLSALQDMRALHGIEASMARVKRTTIRIIKPPKEKKLDVHIHTLSGNCWSGKDTGEDVCATHEEPRGECSECPPCPACDVCPDCGADGDCEEKPR